MGIHSLRGVFALTGQTEALLALASSRLWDLGFRVEG